MTNNIDWKSFLGTHDLLWSGLPGDYLDSPFMGNGMMGAMLYREEGSNGLSLFVHRCDVQDHRDQSYGDTGMSRPRLPIGKFTLEPEGTISGGKMRMDLWNAETTGRIETDKGHIDLQIFVHSEEQIIIAVIKPSKDEHNCSWSWHPAKAVSPRAVYSRQGTKEPPSDYLLNPDCSIYKNKELNFCVQPLLIGGQTATAWLEKKSPNDRILYINISHSFPGTQATKEAARVVRTISRRPLEKLIGIHRAWWHRFYPASFVSLPDFEWQKFYWIQIYKLGAATRRDRALIDNHGPWLAETRWPYATWNLNVQLTYWPVYPSNHLDLGDSLSRTLDANTQALIENVPEEFREDSAGIGVGATLDLRSPVNPNESGMDKTVGDLPWALHNYWLQYMFSMDERRLVRNFFPLLRRSINLYFHLLESDEDGTLHLKETTSPEYGNAPDCNFDLALLRWGCGVLIDICKRHGIDDPLFPEWENVLEKLVDYPVDENGFMIGRAVPYDRGHRHPSHLLMIYPLYLVNIEQPGGRELIEKSLKHWLALGESFGFTFTGAASIAASIGDGNAALEYLNRMIRYPNTLYRERDGKGGPVIETPLSAAKSLQDMLIQSWNGKIRIFPAIPDEWKDVRMANMRTEGAFLISATRENGITLFVHVKSLAGSPCRLIPDLAKGDADDRVSVLRDGQITVRELVDGALELDLKKGEEATVFVGESLPDVGISPVEQSSMQ